MAKKKPSEAMREAIAPKKRGRKPLPKPAIEFKDGLNEIDNIETVPINDIDLEDRRFQYRITEKTTDLIPSLVTEGQLVPVILWGREAPYKILDGFRRTAVIKSIGWISIKAIIHRRISEDDAYRMSFVENFKRKSFSPIDIAHAIWKAQARGKSNDELKVEFHLSLRQLFRFKAMIEFSDEIKEALSNGHITMAHAQVLHNFNVKEISPWVEKIKGGLPAKEMKKLLAKDFSPKTKPRKYFKKEKDGFRLYPIRFSFSASEKHKNEIKKILENALALITQGNDQSGTE